MQPHENANPQQLTQLFFCGSHTGVGGGKRSEIECSNVTLRFVVDEMRRRGLQLFFDMSKIPASGVADLLRHKTHSSKKRSIVKILMGKCTRRIDSVAALHPLAILRYQKCPSWRPVALQHLHQSIMASKSPQQFEYEH